MLRTRAEKERENSRCRGLHRSLLRDGFLWDGSS